MFVLYSTLSLICGIMLGVCMMLKLNPRYGFWKTYAMIWVVAIGLLLLNMGIGRFFESLT